MSLGLDALECRVLGVLIEKSLTQPGSYPLTMNAIVIGANQKQNREPVMDIAEGDVGAALHRLQQMQLVKQAPPDRGARANRFQHNVVERLRWDRPEQAVMAELLLRGRQTPGELRTRASRMAPITDVPSVLHVLQRLGEYESPYVRELAREPGRSVTRFEHLLGEGGSADEAPAAPSAAAARPTTTSRPETNEMSIRDRLLLLEIRVETLEKNLEKLTQRPTHGGPG
ncbi:MAG: DUF480 domain-containing protein [Planctomycetota bacterium]|jgi:uncharacterized protein YceH (UPF0502 family)